MSTNGRNSFKAVCLIVSSAGSAAAVGAGALTAGVGVTGSETGDFAVSIAGSSFWSVATGSGEMVAGLITGEAVAFVSSNCKLLSVFCDTPANTLASSWSSLND